MFLSGFMCVDIIGPSNFDRLVPIENGFAKFIAAKYSDYYLDYHEETALSEAGYDDDEAFEGYFKEWNAFYRTWSRVSPLVRLEDRPDRVVSLVRLLDHIRAKPHMHLPKQSIEPLYSFIRGVQHARVCYAPRARLEPNFDAYEVWLSKRSPLKKLCRWDRLLLAESSFDEIAAFGKFFETLDEFCSRNPRQRRISTMNS